MKDSMHNQFVLCTSVIFYTFPFNSRNFIKVIGLVLVLVSTDNIVQICVHVQIGYCVY